MTDAISDMLARIKNGYNASLKEVAVPWSKARENLAKVLEKNGYLEKVVVVGEGTIKAMTLTLKYDGKEKALADFRRVSKPSLRRYVGKRDLPRVFGGMGIAVISTPKGLMTDREARRQGYGGEIWCEVW